jgi:hypothetical protein
MFPGDFGTACCQLEVVAPANAGLLSLTDSSVLFSLAVDSQDQPVILTQATESNLAAIHVRVRTPAWTDLVPSLPTGSANAVVGASVQIDATGNPLVLWSQQDSSGSNSLRMARFNGTAWDTTYGVLNGVPGAGTDAQYASFGVDKAFAPTVTWTETDTSSGTTSVYVWKSNY